MTKGDAPPLPDAHAFATWARFVPTPPLLITAWFRCIRIDAAVLVEDGSGNLALHQLLLDLVASTENRSEAALLSMASLPPSMTLPLLQRLEACGLLEHTPSGEWQPTARGESMSQAGNLACCSIERRSFDFLLQPESTGLRLLPRKPAGNFTACAVEDSLGRDVFRALDAAIANAPEWKQAMGFPASVHSRVRNPSDLFRWEWIPMLRSFRMQLAGIPAEAGQWTRWNLHALTPAGCLESDALTGMEIDLPPVTGEDWKDAWHSWCGTRRLNDADCTLAIAERSLRANVPIGTARDEILRGDAWLLIDRGPFRIGRRLELRED